MTFELRKIKAGFVGFGEINTPREFIDNRCNAAAELLRSTGMDVFATPPVSDDENGLEAARASRELAQNDFDLLVICIAGWIPSWAVFSVIEKFKHKPMLLWGLTGWTDGDRFVTTADQAGSTALRKPMQDMGYTFKYIVNFRGKSAPVGEILNYAKAARAASLLKEAKIGMIGYRDMRLYGTLYDGVSLKGQIGPEIEHFDLLEIANMMNNYDDAEVTTYIEAIQTRWQLTREPKAETLPNAIRLFLAFKEKIISRGYQGFSFVDVDGVKKLMGFAPAGALTLLHEECDICTVPENDSMGAVTQLMTRFLTGQVAAYLEFYEFMENGALMGVPDYVPTEIVDGPVTVMPNAFGDFGEGLLNVSKLKTGKVTIARLSYCGDKYQMHIMGGEAKSPIKWEEAGWAPPAPQLPSLEVFFDGCTKDFIGKVMGQHYIISYGDNVDLLKELCGILKIEVL